MKKVCVITGGGSGMCFAAAKFIDKDIQVVITGRTVVKLEGAKSELEALGHSVETVACDVSDRESVKELVKAATSLGEVVAVINGAGVSPDMGDASYIFGINALGTVNVNEEFADVLPVGGCIVDVSSIAANMLPPESYPEDLYPLALGDPSELAAKMKDIFAQVPAEEAQFFAYSVSKNFVVWYARQMALKLGKRGIRVVSVAPGSINTPMVQTLEDSSPIEIGKACALGRMGEPEEVGSLLAFLATEPQCYVTATDVVCDGGYLAAMQAQAAQA